MISMSWTNQIYSNVLLEYIGKLMKWDKYYDSVGIAIMHQLLNTEMCVGLKERNCRETQALV